MLITAKYQEIYIPLETYITHISNIPRGSKNLCVNMFKYAWRASHSTKNIHAYYVKI